MPDSYNNPGPDREQIDASIGPVLLEFGVDWCPHCQNAEPLVSEHLRAFPSVKHIKVEDGAGRKLGRSFRVKLWPSLIFLRDGKELARVVRPQSGEEIRGALLQITDRLGEN